MNGKSSSRSEATDKVVYSTHTTQDKRTSSLAYVSASLHLYPTHSLSGKKNKKSVRKFSKPLSYVCGPVQCVAMQSNNPATLPLLPLRSSLWFLFRFTISLISVPKGHRTAISNTIPSRTILLAFLLTEHSFFQDLKLPLPLQGVPTDKMEFGLASDPGSPLSTGVMSFYSLLSAAAV